MSVNKAWPAAARLAPLFCPESMLGNYDAVGPFQEAEFIPREHRLSWFLPKEQVSFSKNVVLAICCCPEYGLTGTKSEWVEAIESR